MSGVKTTEPKKSILYPRAHFVHDKDYKES